jgi:protein SCO1
MPRLSGRSLDQYPLPLASVLALAAAVFMIVVWGPIQQRDFTQETRLGWMDTSFTTSDGNTTSLSASNGHVRIVTMLYAHCPGICPLNVATLGRIENQLSSTERNQLRVVALTLDPERDSLTSLGEFRRTHGIDSKRWSFGRPSTASVAQLAAGVGITYRTLPDGTLDHQSVFTLLDESGQVIARTANTRNPDPEFVAAVRRTLQE